MKIISNKILETGVGVFILLFILNMISCVKPKPEPINLYTNGYILADKKSLREIIELEEHLYSKKGKDKFNYIRETEFGIPLDVTYSIQNDTILSVDYYVGKLPRQKDKIEMLLSALIKLLEKRLNIPVTMKLDKKRDYMTTRIDFKDEYYWNKKHPNKYAASIHFEDSGRAGKTNLLLTIRFY